MKLFMKKRYYILFGFLILIGLWVGYGFIRCAQEADIIELEFDRSNPTEYVFPFSISKIRSSLSRDTIAFFKGSFLWCDSVNHYSIQDYTGNDSYVYRYRKTKIGADQNTCLSVILDSLSPDCTKVKVIPIFNHLLTGVKFWITLDFTNYVPKVENIASTTIEEYELLRFIGKRLHYIEKMPLTKYPKQLTKEQIIQSYGRYTTFTYEELFGTAP